MMKIFRQSRDYEALDDQALVQLLNAGDSVAFNLIFNRYSRLLLSYAYRNLKSWEDAEDVVQEFFASLWKRHDTVRIDRKLEVYCFIAMKNLIFMKYRSKDVAQRFLDNFRPELYTEQDYAEFLVRRNDFSAIIEAEINALPDKMRLIFELSRKRHLSRKEIAEELGIPEATVRININRALKALKKKLRPFCYAVLLSNLDPEIFSAAKDSSDCSQTVNEPASDYAMAADSNVPVPFVDRVNRMVFLPFKFLKKSS